MTPATFETWLKPSRLVERDEGQIIVAVASSSAKDWLENRLHTTIERTVQNLIGEVTISYIIAETETA
ncbi:MAG: DnaA N-terminal domain-containing protein, partial [Gammaproteobacteria bacterium]